MKKRYSKRFFQEAGKSWWLGLTDEERQKKTEGNRKASVKRWKMWREKKALETVDKSS